jgi:hypothetical protein
VLAVLALGVVAAAAPVQAAPTKARSKAMRTLEAITIEGEIAVPQVLFITSRDYPRYRDGLALKFRMSALDVARSADRPTRLRVVVQPDSNKEAGK